MTVKTAGRDRRNTAIRKHGPTRLDTFMQSRGLKTGQLARTSGYSRQHMLRVRKGVMEPSRPCIAAIVAACRELSGEAIRASDLFDLGEGLDSPLHAFTSPPHA